MCLPSMQGMLGSVPNMAGINQARWSSDTQSLRPAWTDYSRTCLELGCLIQRSSEHLDVMSLNTSYFKIYFKMAQVVKQLTSSCKDSFLCPPNLFPSTQFCFST